MDFHIVRLVHAAACLLAMLAPAAVAAQPTAAVHVPELAATIARQLAKPR